MNQEIFTEKEYQLQCGDARRKMAKANAEKKSAAPMSFSGDGKIRSSLSHVPDEDYLRIFGHL